MDGISSINRCGEAVDRRQKKGRAACARGQIDRYTRWMLAGFLLISLLLSVVGTLGNVLAMVAVDLRLPLWLAMVTFSTGITACAVLLVQWAWSLTGGRSLGG